jgi:kynureninase
MRPVLTGWFAEFAELEHRSDRTVQYPTGAVAFLGATYDPTSNYRAAAVFAFHQQQELTPDRLRALSQRQVALLAREFESLDIDPVVAAVEPIPAERRGGFLAIRTSHAREFAHAMKQRGVLCDARGNVLRLGPAPYVRDDQLHDSITVLKEVIATAA